MVTTHKIELTNKELGHLCAALDAYVYWQLSDPIYRTSGGVLDPGSDDEEEAASIAAARALEEKLYALKVKRG